MNKMKKLIVENKWIILFFAIIYICIFILTTNSFYAPDEFNFSNIPWTEERVMSLKDILTSQKMLYMKTTGRILAHSLIYLMLYLGLHFFDIINGLVFIVFIYFIGRVTGNKNTKLGLILTVIMTTLLIPMFGEKIIWLSGSINYLWMVTLMIIFMYKIYKYIVLEKSLKIVDKIVLLVLAFCCGWSQENTAFTTGMFLIILYALNWKKVFLDIKKNVFFNFLIIVIFGIGALGLIIAPGNFNRLNEGDSLFYIENFINNILELKYLFILFLSVSILMLFNKDNRYALKNSLVYFVLPAAIALLPMLIIRDFAPRSMFPLEACIFISIIDSVYYIEKRISYKAIKIFQVGLSIVVVVPLMYLSFFYLKYVREYKNNIQQEVDLGIIKDKEEIVVSKFDKQNKILNNYDMVIPYPQTLDTSIINTYMGHYYKFDSIWATTEECAIIVIDVEQNLNLDKYCLVDKNNVECIIATRIKEDTKTNRVVFEISNEKLEDIAIKIPDKGIIKNISLKTLEEIKNIELEIVAEED